jgi:hypothetical protein
VDQDELGMHDSECRCLLLCGIEPTWRVQALATLRDRDIAAAAGDIAKETGLMHRPVTDGERVSGIYRRSVQLASGRFAMLDDGSRFSLVLWRPIRFSSGQCQRAGQVVVVS